MSQSVARATCWAAHVTVVCVAAAAAAGGGGGGGAAAAALAALAPRCLIQKENGYFVHTLIFFIACGVL